MGNTTTEAQQLAAFLVHRFAPIDKRISELFPGVIVFAVSAGRLLEAICEFLPDYCAGVGYDVPPSILWVNCGDLPVQSGEIIQIQARTDVDLGRIGVMAATARNQGAPVIIMTVMDKEELEKRPGMKFVGFCEKIKAGVIAADLVASRMSSYHPDALSCRITDTVFVACAPGGETGEIIGALRFLSANLPGWALLEVSLCSACGLEPKACLESTGFSDRIKGIVESGRKVAIFIGDCGLASFTEYGDALKRAL